MVTSLSVAEDDAVDTAISVLWQFGWAFSNKAEDHMSACHGCMDTSTQLNVNANSYTSNGTSFEVHSHGRAVTCSTHCKAPVVSPLWKIQMSS